MGGGWVRGPQYLYQGGHPPKKRYCEMDSSIKIPVVLCPIFNFEHNYSYPFHDQLQTRTMYTYYQLADCCDMFRG